MPPAADPQPDAAPHPAPTWDTWLNGRFAAPDQALVPVEDAGLQHAVGLFETFQAHHGRVFRLHRHLDRLAASAAALGLAADLQTAPLAEAVKQVLAHNRLQRARLRLTLTAGRLSLLRERPPTGGAAGDTAGPAGNGHPAPPTAGPP